MDAEALAELLGSYRFSYANEIELQDGIGAVLDLAGVPHAREVDLGRAGRIDFVVGHGLGVEVKIKGAAADVDRQLRRYLDADGIDEVMLVTTRRQQAVAVAADAIDGIRVVVLR